MDEAAAALAAKNIAPQNLPRLFRRAFSMGFDKLPAEGLRGKRSFCIDDREKIGRIMDVYGIDIERHLSHHVNFGMLEEDCCRTAFVRGAFFAGGSITDPLKRYHLELTTTHSFVAGEVSPLMEELLPLATLVTPNIPEAQVLSGLTIRGKEDMAAAAKQIGDTFHCAVLVKGGHSIPDANDLLYSKTGIQWFHGKRISNPNTHGTGCTLSSAIASNLAKGCDLPASIQSAKDYISGALAAMLDLGKGSGPMNHAWQITFH